LAGTCPARACLREYGTRIDGNLAARSWLHPEMAAAYEAAADASLLKAVRMVGL